MSAFVLVPGADVQPGGHRIALANPAQVAEYLLGA